MKLILSENKSNIVLSEGFEYHVKNNLNLSESVYRLGSDAWVDLINEARALYKLGHLGLNDQEKAIVESNVGEYGEYMNEDVPLDAPFLEYVSKDGKKLYGVFVLDESFKTKKVNFTEDLSQLNQLLKESEKNYMFVQNLKDMVMKAQEILKLNPNKMDKVLDKHQWAVDHISRSVDDLDEVAAFLLNNDQVKKFYGDLKSTIENE